MAELASPQWHAGMKRFAGKEAVLRENDLYLMVESTLIPGLLQDAAYASEAVRGSLPGCPAEDVERLVQARLARQAILSGGAEFCFIIDEAVIRRTGPDPRIMQGQLEHLVRVAQMRRVTIRVVPFGSVLVYPGRVAYVIIKYGRPPFHDFLYWEGADEVGHVDHSDRMVERYTEHFAWLSDFALSKDDTVRLLHRRIGELDRG